jgi:hypothetical protein
VQTEKTSSNQWDALCNTTFASRCANFAFWCSACNWTPDPALNSSNNWAWSFTTSDSSFRICCCTAPTPGDAKKSRRQRNSRCWSSHLRLQLLQNPESYFGLRGRSKSSVFSRLPALDYQVAGIQPWLPQPSHGEFCMSLAQHARTISAIKAQVTSDNQKPVKKENQLTCLRYTRFLENKPRITKMFREKGHDDRKSAFTFQHPREQWLAARWKAAIALRTRSCELVAMFTSSSQSLTGSYAVGARFAIALCNANSCFSNATLQQTIINTEQTVASTSTSASNRWHVWLLSV